MPPNKRQGEPSPAGENYQHKKLRSFDDRLPELPVSVLAHILTYQVRSIADLARMRVILPSIVRCISENHWIQCPFNQGFYTSLAEAKDKMREEFGMPVGQVFFFEDGTVDTFPFCLFKRLRILGEPKPFDPTETPTLPFDAFSAVEVYIRGKELCQKLDSPTQVDQFEKMVDQVHRMALCDPCSQRSEREEESQNRKPRARLSIRNREKNKLFQYPALLTVTSFNEMLSSGTIIKNTDGTMEITLYDGSLSEEESVTSVDDILPEFPFPFFVNSAFNGYNFRLFPSSDDEDDDLAYVFLHIVGESDRIKAWLDDEPSSQVNYAAAWNRHQEGKLVEGVAIVDGALSKEAQRKLNDEIEQFVQLQQQRGLISTESDFRGKIRFYVNPNLFGYVKGQAALRSDPKEVPPCVLNADFKERSEDEDFWGRLYHKADLTCFQYLPSYVTISPNGECSFDNYINHITPKEDFCGLYDSLASIIQLSLPFMESVLSHSRCMASAMFSERPDNGEQDKILNDAKFVSLRGQRLQVILQIFEECLGPGDSIEGRDNHVEGMPHEEIVLSVCYIAHRDRHASRGYMQFQRPFLKDEVAYIRNVWQDGLYTRDGMIVDGIVPLGQVDILDGRLFVAPNSHIRQWCSWFNKSNTEIAKSRKVIFHLVNPMRRLVSTREVAPQQEHSGGPMSLDAARKLLEESLSRRNEECQFWNDPDLTTRE